MPQRLLVQSSIALLLACASCLTAADPSAPVVPLLPDGWGHPTWRIEQTAEGTVAHLSGRTALLVVNEGPTSIGDYLEPEWANLRAEMDQAWMGARKVMVGRFAVPEAAVVLEIDPTLRWGTVGALLQLSVDTIDETGRPNTAGPSAMRTFPAAILSTSDGRAVPLRFLSPRPLISATVRAAGIQDQIEIRVLPTGINRGSGVRENERLLAAGAIDISRLEVSILGQTLVYAPGADDPAALVTFVMDQLGRAEATLAERWRQPSILVNAFSGLDAGHVIEVLDAIVSFESAVGGSFPLAVDASSRILDVAPPRIRHFRTWQLGNELFELAHMRTATQPPPAWPADSLRTAAEAMGRASTAPQHGLELPIQMPVVTEVEIEIEVDIEVEVAEVEVGDATSAGGADEGAEAAIVGGRPRGDFIAMPGSGGAAGLFGNRSGGGRRRAVGQYGGSRASENAVESALRWFKRHQSPNGQWDVDGYPANCEGGPKCEPGTLLTSPEADRALTAYALLTFLGSGYDHRTPNRYRRVVQTGIEWLVAEHAAAIAADRNYANAVVAMALAEAYGMTGDVALREPAQTAIDALIQRQAHGDDGNALGWDYVQGDAARNDTSVSAWMVAALVSARAAGLEVGTSLDGARAAIAGAWQAANPSHASLDPAGSSTFPYTWNAETDEIRPLDGSLTGLGTLMALQTGSQAGDVMPETMATWVVTNQLPDTWPLDTYHLYHSTQAMFRMGGEHWQAWNTAMRDLLINAQRREDPGGCFEGSWDPIGAGGHNVADVGRLLVTAYCAMSLQVYYRYAPTTP